MNQSAVPEEFCFPSKLLGLTSVLFSWHESGVSDVRFLEPVPCFSLNKAWKNSGTCFDVQNGWQRFLGRAFAQLIIQLFGSLHAKECALLGAICLFEKKVLESSVVFEESCILNLMSEKGLIISWFPFFLFMPRMREHAASSWVPASALVEGREVAGDDRPGLSPQGPAHPGGCLEVQCMWRGIPFTPKCLYMCDSCWS